MNPACAHSRVSYRTEEPTPGLVDDAWWECDSNCGQRFSQIPPQGEPLMPSERTKELVTKLIVEAYNHHGGHANQCRKAEVALLSHIAEIEKERTRLRKMFELERDEAVLQMEYAESLLIQLATANERIAKMHAGIEKAINLMAGVENNSSAFVACMGIEGVLRGILDRGTASSAPMGNL